MVENPSKGPQRLCRHRMAVGNGLLCTWCRDDYVEDLETHVGVLQRRIEILEATNGVMSETLGMARTLFKAVREKIV